MVSIARQITSWRRPEIELLFKKSYRAFTSPAFDVRLARTSDIIGKILVITPRKTGSAPERNRFRRRVKAIFYQEKLYQRGYHWVIFAKKGGLAASFQSIKALMLGIVPA